MDGATSYDDESGTAAVSKDKGKGKEKAVDMEGEGVKEMGMGMGKSKDVFGIARGGDDGIYWARDAAWGSGSRGDGDIPDGDGGGGGQAGEDTDEAGSDVEEEQQSEDRAGDRDDGEYGEEEDGEVADEGGDEEHLISDPLSDPQERKALTSTLSSYFLYRRTAHLNLTHQRRKGYLGLPRRHRDVLEQTMRRGGGEGGQQQDGDGGYLAMLRRVDDCIEKNAEIAEGIFASGVDAFGIPAELDSEVEDEDEGGGVGGEVGKAGANTGKTKGVSKGWWETDASNEDIDKVKSTLKQLYRDWAKEGEGERIKCYKPVLDELCDRFPLNGDDSVGGGGGVGVGEEGEEVEEVEGGDGDCNQSRSRRRDQVRVLVPGAGLGRLAFDIVRAGFESQGNEFSYHQLAASNFMLNW